VVDGSFIWVLVSCSRKFLLVDRTFLAQRPIP